MRPSKRNGRGHPQKPRVNSNGAHSERATQGSPKDAGALPGSPPLRHAASQEISPGGSGSTGARRPGNVPRWRVPQTLWSLLILLMAAAIAVKVVVAADGRRLPTRVVVKLTTKTLCFTIADAAPIPLIAPTSSFHSLSFSRFDSVQLPGGIGWQTVNPDPKYYDPQTVSYSEKAWYGLTATRTGVSLSRTSPSEDPQISLDGLPSLMAPFSLDPVDVEQGDRVSLSVTGGTVNDLSLLVRGQRKKCQVLYNLPYQVTATGCRVRGLTGARAPSTPESLQYRVRQGQTLPGQNVIQVTGSPDTLEIQVQVPNSQRSEIFPDQRIPVSAVDFSKLGKTGDVASTLTGGDVTYPDDPKEPDVTIQGQNYLIMDQLQDFSIDQIELLPDGQGLAVTMEGTANQMRVEREAGSQDLRLTRLDTILQSPYSGAVSTLSSLLCVLTGIIGVLTYLWGKDKGLGNGKNDAK